jgi:hypothetical protein
MKCDICEKRMLFGHHVAIKRRHPEKSMRYHTIKAEFDESNETAHLPREYAVRTQNKLIQSCRIA